MVSPQQSRKRVRFSKMSTMIIVEDRARGDAIKQKLWYSGEDVDQFKVEATQISNMLRRFFSCREESRDDDQVSTRAEYSGASIDLEEISVDLFLGLEKRLTGEYYPRRQLLMSKVMEEHLWQRLRSKVGCSFDDEEAARIASTSEEYSQWARERAYASALLLQQDLLHENSASSHRYATQFCTNTERRLKKERPIYPLESFSENHATSFRD